MGPCRVAGGGQQRVLGQPEASCQGHWQQGEGSETLDLFPCNRPRLSAGLSTLHCPQHAVKEADLHEDIEGTRVKKHAQDCVASGRGGRIASQICLSCFRGSVLFRGSPSRRLLYPPWELAASSS